MPQKDRTFEKDFKTTDRKLPKVLFDMMDNLKPIDIWRHKNANAKEYIIFLNNTVVLKNQLALCQLV